MSTYATLYLSLFSLVWITFIINLFQVFKESARLTAEGKTPLTGRNITTVILAAATELIVIGALTVLYIKLRIPANAWTVIGMFLVAYVLRNVGAYLVAWGAWSVFVRADRKKLQKELQEEKGEALK